MSAPNKSRVSKSPSELEPLNVSSGLSVEGKSRGFSVWKGHWWKWTEADWPLY